MADTQDTLVVVLPQFVAKERTPFNESDPSLYAIGEAWDIESNTPRWPNGKKLYEEDKERIDTSIGEALQECATRGTFKWEEHLRLAQTIIEGMEWHNTDISTGVDPSHLSLAFLAGAAWAKKNQAGGA